LISAGADPSKPDYDGRTALHVAALRGYEDIVRFLIQRGANVNSIGMPAKKKNSLRESMQAIYPRQTQYLKTTFL
jgi:ankyrin repeat protein